MSSAPRPRERRVVREELDVLLLPVFAIARRAGYEVGLYGSLLKRGWGHDVDLVLWRLHAGLEPDRSALEQALEARGWRLVEKYVGASADAGAWARDGIILDVRFLR